MYKQEKKFRYLKTYIGDLKAKSKILVDFGWLQLFIRPVGTRGRGRAACLKGRGVDTFLNPGGLAVHSVRGIICPPGLNRVHWSTKLQAPLSPSSYTSERAWITTCPLEFSDLPTTLFMAFVDEDRPSGTPAVFQFTPLGHFCCFVVQLACTLCDVFDTVSTVKIVMN